MALEELDGDPPPDLDALKAQLRTMVAATSEPTLAVEETDSLFDQCARPDREGWPPHDDDWAPTYDLAIGAAAGWRLKAAKVAGDFDFESDQQRFWRSQVRANCLEQAEYYDSQIERSVRVR